MKQKTEPIAPPVLLSRIGVLYRTVRRNATTLFRNEDFPLDLDQTPVLLIAYYSGGASQQSMGTTLQRDKASINRTVAFLVTKGFVTVETDPENRRKTIVKTTTEGANYARQADRIISDYNATLSATLTTEEQQILYKLMNRLIEAETSTPLIFSL